MKTNLNENMKDCHTKVGETEFLNVNIHKRLIEEIRNYPFVIGCMFSLSHPVILSELMEKRVHIIIDNGNVLDDTRQIHNKLTPISIGECDSVISEKTGGSLPEKAIYEIGDYIDYSLMHNKFLIFCSSMCAEYAYAEKVWMGSANVSECSERSLETVMISKDQDIIKFHLDVFFQISEMAENYKPSELSLIVDKVAEQMGVIK